MNLAKYTTKELLLIYYNQTKKACLNNPFSAILRSLESYDNYDNYGNYDNYDDYTNYSNYDDYSNYDNYDNYSDGNYSDSYSDSGCFAKDTLINLRGGKQIKVEDLKNEEILAFDHETGTLTYTNKYYIRHLEGRFETVTLTFSDGSTFKIFDGHGFFDLDYNKYVIIDMANASEYLGHHFLKINYVDGKETYTTVTLDSAIGGYEEGECYSIVTGSYINHVANSFLCVSDGIDGTFNLFEYDSNYKYDSSKKMYDIGKYDLMPYSDWKDYVSKEEFDTFNMQYFNVAFGKNLCTIDDLKHYIKDFLAEYRD